MAFALGSLPTCTRRSAPARRVASGAAAAPVASVAAKRSDLRACAAPALAGRRLDSAVRASHRAAASRDAVVVTEAAFKARPRAPEKLVTGASRTAVLPSGAGRGQAVAHWDAR